MLSQKQNHHLFLWWQRLVLPQSQLKSAGLRPAPSGYRAQLKRADSIDAILMQEAFQLLWAQMPQPETLTASKMECVAVIAASLMYVVPGCEDSLGAAAGKKSGATDKPLVSNLRFSKLMATQTPEEFYRTLRRVLLLIQGRVDPMKLSHDIELWFMEYNNQRSAEARNRLSVRWAMDYFRAAN